MRVQERSGTKNGAKMAPKWVSKWIKSRSKNMIDFLIGFEALLEPPPVGEPPPGERAGAVEGGRGEA